jgi:transcriptional regulator with XRE-family HTH domain
MTPRSKTAEVGQRLAAARMQRGLSQGTVARLSGIAPSYLSRIENAKVHPTFRTAQRIASALKISLDVITGAPADHAHPDGKCPISTSGACMLDLIRSEAQVKKVASGEVYTAREVRLLQRMAEWMRDAGPERLRSMEILLDDLTRGRAAAKGVPAKEARRRR